MKIISFVSLAAGQEKFGWDKNGTSADIEIYFNTDTLELTLRSSQSLPKVAVHSQVTTDLFGKSTSDTRAAGPLADSGAKQIWKLDPRHAVQA
jgi:hypothetical protein